MFPLLSEKKNGLWTNQLHCFGFFKAGPASVAVNTPKPLPATDIV